MDKVLNSELIKNKSGDRDFIPCMYMPYEAGSAKLFLYFHANAEDLGRSYRLLCSVQKLLRMHVLAVEYPGYGIFRSPEGAKAEKIVENAESVYKFLT
jgi:hypothetical protein